MDRPEVIGSTGSHRVDTVVMFFSPTSKSGQDSKVLYRKALWFRAHPSIDRAESF